VWIDSAGVPDVAYAVIPTRRNLYILVSYYRRFSGGVFIIQLSHETDCILTIGGYNLACGKILESHYLTVSARVGIFWKYDAQSHMTSEFYF
jgi:hypothetical protein